MSDPKETARLELAGLQSLEDRVRLMIVSGLAVEFCAELTTLVEAGICSLETGRLSVSAAFYEPRQYASYDEYQYLLVEPVGGSRVWKVSLAGLKILVQEDTALKAGLRQLLTVRRVAGLSDCADAIVAESFFRADAELRGPIELTMFRNSLLGTATERAFSWLAVDDRLYDPETALEGMIGRLTKLDVTEDEIYAAILELLRDENNLTSTSKIVALVSAYDGRKMPLRICLAEMAVVIYKLQLGDDWNYSKLDHVAFLCDRGLPKLSALLHEDAINSPAAQLVIDRIANGELPRVIQHLTLMDEAASFDSALSKAEGLVRGLLVPAFELAMAEQRFGVAVAIVQEDDCRWAVSDRRLGGAIRAARKNGQEMRHKFHYTFPPPEKSSRRR